MWKLYLKTPNICEDLTKICLKFKRKFNVDIGYGRYLVDGCSILGVMSLMFHDVEIWVPIVDGISDFESEIIKIGARKNND